MIDHPTLADRLGKLAAVEDPALAADAQALRQLWRRVR
jgi:hypothetical protein